MPRPTLQIVSDTHIEHRDKSWADVGAPSPVATALCLAGDIGIAGTEALHTFLRDCGRKFERVLYVAGNHEYYDTEAGHPGCRRPMDESEALIRAAMPGNGEFLQCEASRPLSDGRVVLGCTMWAEGSHDLANPAWHYSDFNHIAELTRGGMALYQQLHRKHTAWLRDAVKAETDGGRLPPIVMTHHVPRRDLEHAGAVDRELWVADAERVRTTMAALKGSAWVHGRTHTRTLQRISRRHTVCVQCGWLPGRR